MNRAASIDKVLSGLMAGLCCTQFLLMIVPAWSKNQITPPSVSIPKKAPTSVKTATDLKTAKDLKTATTPKTTTPARTRILQFPDSMDIGKVFALEKNWKYEAKRNEDTLIGPAVHTLSVNFDQPLKLKLGYHLIENPDLLSKVAPDAFVKVDSDRIEFEDSICKPISKLVSIVRLEMSATEITDKGVEALSTLPNIRALFLDRTDINGSCLHALGATKSLRYLMLDNNAISPTNFKYFAGLPPLTILSLVDCGLDDDALKYIGQITSIEELRLRGSTKITDQGLKNLKNMKHLRRLLIDTAKITAQGLEQLKGLPLNLIVVPKYVLDAGGAGLQAAFPQTTLSFRPGKKNDSETQFLYAPLK